MKKASKVVLAAVGSVFLLGAGCTIGAGMSGIEEEMDTKPVVTEVAKPVPAEEKAVEATKPPAPLEDLEGVETPEEEKKAEKEVAPVSEAKPEPAISVSQENANKKAESYIDTMPFSKTGLAEQLEFDGFTPEEAKVAVDAVEVDWTEQAKLQAESYNELMPMSRTELIDQLVFDGYPEADAVVAVDALGL